MKREEKTAVVEDLAGRLESSQAIFAVDYKGISVTQSAELRSRLREAGTEFKVVKNRLAKLAAEKAGTRELDEHLIGPTALALIDGDAVVVAKAITDFAKEHEILTYKGGLMDGAPLDPESFHAIARLPGLEVLHGQLVGLAASPLTGLVAGMSNMISGLGRQLAQIAEQGLVSGEAPAAEAPEPEAPVEDPTPEEAPVEEPPAEEPPPEPEAEASGETPADEAATETEVETNPEEVDAQGETSEGPEVDAEGEASEG